MFHCVNFDISLFVQDFDKLINLINKCYYYKRVEINFVITVKPPNTGHLKYRTPPNSGQKPYEGSDLLLNP